MKKKVSCKHVVNIMVFVISVAFLIFAIFFADDLPEMPGAMVKLGLCLLAIFMMVQFRKWWMKNKEKSERAKFLGKIIRCATSSDNPDENINRILGFMGEEFRAGRTFVFEDQHDGTYANTYEWCAQGVEPKAADFTHLPYKGHVDRMVEDMKNSGSAVIRDISHLDRNARSDVKELLSRNDISNTITAPMEVNGEVVGFCGLDNVSDSERFDDAAETASLMAYFFSQLIVQRDNNKRLQRFGYNDSMTGVGNRRAFERYKSQWLDAGVTYSYVMCDINGLKMVNDMAGHEAGDAMIKDVASCLSYIFGEGNVFRMGGDEFVAIFRDGDELALKKKINGVRVMLKHKERSASIGYVYNQDGSIPYEEVKIKADKLMYTEKEEYYSGKNDRRRRKR